MVVAWLMPVPFGPRKRVHSWPKHGQTQSATLRANKPEPRNLGTRALARRSHRPGEAAPRNSPPGNPGVGNSPPSILRLCNVFIVLFSTSRETAGPARRGPARSGEVRRALFMEPRHREVRSVRRQDGGLGFDAVVGIAHHDGVVLPRGIADCARVSVQSRRACG